MASELNLSNVGGVFVVLIGGMGLALVVAIFEFLGECREISKDDDVSTTPCLYKDDDMSTTPSLYKDDDVSTTPSLWDDDERTTPSI